MNGKRLEKIMEKLGFLSDFLIEIMIEMVKLKLLELNLFFFIFSELNLFLLK